ncbi:MAG: hypothetical protein H7Y07_18530 [Pyrinomonadaceae bacterium]|nr:hypothetical protein [Sphingobacteriaceae bacterium]
MEVQEKDNKDDGIYFLLAILCGIATAWVITGSIAWMLFGALIGLIVAGFFVTAIVRSKTES